MLFGHIAVTALMHRYLKADFGPVIVGGLFPDIVDKTLCQVLRLTPSGRMAAHTLLGWAISTFGAGLFSSRKAAWSWGVGYLGHLVADSGGFVPWFYPFIAYRFKPSSTDILKGLRNLFLHPRLLEVMLIVWAALAWAAERRR